MKYPMLEFIYEIALFTTEVGSLVLQKVKDLETIDKMFNSMLYKNKVYINSQILLSIKICHNLE